MNTLEINMKNLILRNETEQDYRAVEELTREAFWNLLVPGCNEHYLVHIMRDHSDFIRELDFVAELDGRIVGSIMYAKASLVAEDGTELNVVGFGPISVLPEFQRQGIGRRLIEHTKQLAAQRGAKGIIILGDPHNYCSIGFRSSRDFNIHDPNGDYPYGMLALELEPGAFTGHTWTFTYSDLYNISEEQAEQFDRTFPAKEKKTLPTHEIFSIAIRAFLK